MARTLAKDVHSLLRNISSLSGGQANVTDWDMDNLESICVEISPTDGYYKGGKFKFKLNISSENYPSYPPIVNCLTEIYHPNIDTMAEYDDCDDYEPDPDNSNVCLNILEQGEWNADMSLEDCVQGLLFLFHNPNFDDPLSPLFNPGIDMEEFQSNVLQSLKGGEVEGVTFKPNYGFPKDQKDEDANDIVETILNGLIDKVTQPHLENIHTETDNSDIESKCGESSMVVKEVIDEMLNDLFAQDENNAENVANGVLNDIIDKMFMNDDHMENDPKVKDSSDLDKVPLDQNTEGQDPKDDEARDTDLQQYSNAISVDWTQDNKSNAEDKVKSDGEVNEDFSVESQVKNQDEIVHNTLIINDSRKSIVRSESYIEISDNFKETETACFRHAGKDEASVSDNIDFLTEENVSQSATENYKYHPPFHESLSVKVC